MGRWFKHIFLIIFCLGLLNNIAQPADKQIVIDSLVIVDSSLVIDFRAEGIIDDAMIERLRSGFTSTMEFQIEIWKKRPFLFSQFIHQKSFQIKLAYDTWDNRYQIVSSDEDRKTSSIQRVREICSNYQKITVCANDKIHQNSTYFATVRLIVRPMSIENLEEIERALKGNKSQNEKTEKYPTPQASSRNRFLKFILAVTGFGDQVLSSRNVEFTLNDKNKIMWLN
ncbi:DUF4390 domain-containing protein [candidate division KSB1 bacterium]|nr:DUF4390 domain-containing protein [candidate division KSB1 bacterium]